MRTHFAFQELFNDIRKFSIQWVLTPIITFWRFRNPSGLQLPKWEFTWECGGSFLHTLLQFQEHEKWLLGFTLGPHLCNPYLGHEPETRVATLNLMQLLKFIHVLMFIWFWNLITFFSNFLDSVVNSNSMNCFMETFFPRSKIQIRVWHFLVSNFVV
jgi:hypothetical protein